MKRLKVAPPSRNEDLRQENENGEQNEKGILHIYIYPYI